MRLLLVGDYHAEPSDLDDCQKLADFIVNVATENKATVVFMGDQYHTHAIIHAEVQLFWITLYKRLQANGLESISIVGNHDRPGSSHSKASAMLAHIEQTKVITSPTLYNGFLFCPYYDDSELFVKICNEFPTNVIFCHQTFNGAAYDNGFYDKHGPDPNLVPQKLIISGHIHTPQEFSKIWYIGSPRWRTLSDANIERAIWLIDFNSDGTIAKKTSFDTGEVCRKIYAVEDREDGTSLLPAYMDPHHEWRIDIHGSQEYIENRSALFRASLGAKVRTFRTQNEQPKVKESEGIAKAFEKWVEEFQPLYATDKETLKTMLKERVNFG